MGRDLKELIEGKTDKDLQKYLDNCIVYTPEAVEYAIAEMKKRGRVFSDEEVAGVRHKMQMKREEREAEEKEAMQPVDINLVDDATAPSYYSQRTIYGFGFFSVLFAAVLLAMNVNKAGSKKVVWEIIICGIIFTVFQIWIGSIVFFTDVHVRRKYLLVAAVGGIGVFFMLELFWKKYIGKDTKYRTKPIWTPLIIGLIIIVPVVYVVIYRGV